MRPRRQSDLVCLSQSGRPANKESVSQEINKSLWPLEFPRGPATRFVESAGIPVVELPANPKAKAVRLEVEAALVVVVAVVVVVVRIVAVVVVAMVVVAMVVVMLMAVAGLELVLVEVAAVMLVAVTVLMTAAIAVAGQSGRSEQAAQREGGSDKGGEEEAIHCGDSKGWLREARFNSAICWVNGRILKQTPCQGRKECGPSPR